MSTREGPRASAKISLFGSSAETSAVAPYARGFSAAAIQPNVLGELSRAVLASTLHRLRRGEGALLAVNLSLIFVTTSSLFHGLAATLVSALVIGLMYAFNDAYDAAADRNNPRKDRALVSTYLAHRQSCMVLLFALKVVTFALAYATLGARAGAATAGVMTVNVVYSTLFKGVPLVDVAWCGLWGALYAGIVTTSPLLLWVIALMTATCHLYQTLGDRKSDAANGIMTTAVRSSALSTSVLLAVSMLSFFALRGPLGAPWALTTFAPVVFSFAVARPGAAWLLTKAYFGVVWLFVLGITHAAG